MFDSFEVSTLMMEEFAAIIAGSGFPKLITAMKVAGKGNNHYNDNSSRIKRVFLTYRY